MMFEVPTTVVAIPARDEANHICACLEALAQQTARNFGVLLLLNNCCDDTASRARQMAPSLPFVLRVEERDLPPDLAHAGGARRAAMDGAASWLREAGSGTRVILTTDADTLVGRDWVARHRAGFAAGYDAVAGYVIDDPAEHRLLPATLRRRGRWEACYGWLLTELQTRLDPDPYDPWPRHLLASGANLGVTLETYLQVGGLPVQPCGEDRAFVQLLSDCGARIRHCLHTRVVTSCRLAGRAAGGMADTMRRRIAEPDAYCDDTMETVIAAYHRYSWRGRLRRQFAAGRIAATVTWASDLCVRQTTAVKLAELKRFQLFWAELEKSSPLLRYGRLRPDDLPHEIAIARDVLRRLRGRKRSNRGSSGCSRLPGYQPISRSNPLKMEFAANERRGARQRFDCNTNWR